MPRFSNKLTQARNVASPASVDAPICTPVAEAQLGQLQGCAVNGTPSPLGDAVAPGTQPGTDDFDLAAIDELRLVFAPADLEALSLRFSTLCENRMRLLTQAAKDADWACIATEAHHLGGTAGSFGLYGLTFLGRALEDAARAQDPARIASLLGQIRTALAIGLPRVRAVCARGAAVAGNVPGGHGDAGER